MAWSWSGFLLFTLSSTLVLQFNLNTAQTFVYKFCYDEYSPLSNRTYDTNLNLLLSSISNNTTGNRTRFYTTTVGRSPDRIYGVFQCRGDLGAEDCKKCAEIATTDMKVRCPYSKQIFIWYDECWLHYSNNHTVSTMLNQPTDAFNWGNNASNPKLFMSKLNQLLHGIVAQAVDNSTNIFATGMINVTNSRKIYGLVQCTQDISRRDCDRCLKEAIAEIPICCDHKEALRILKPSCVIWYEVFKFFEYDYFSTAILPPSENAQGGENSSKAVIIIVVTTVTMAVLLFIIITFFCMRKYKSKDVEKTISADSLQFNLGTIVAATDNFSDSNKLREDGFGSVYKGTLPDGRDIAVKRLATNSGQGVEEFKNEVLLLAKLQHRNLVSLVGFCLERNEKLLIYQYMPNASLDHFLFDSVEGTFLDWERRYSIIGGIARGLLYLHEDSQDRIIHRNLKPSNILLDNEMNPKISDFGTARLFVEDQTHCSTRNIAGTYGYMAPEYAMHGHFSVKSDVFSFGVILLEIVTGKQNSSFHLEKHSQDLLNYVWRQWKEGTILELLEPTLRESYSRNEVMRCVHIGLLCVQEDVARRPTMESVLLMLSSYSVTLPLPSAPAVYVSASVEFDVIKEGNGTYTM